MQSRITSRFARSTRARHLALLALLVFIAAAAARRVHDPVIIIAQAVRDSLNSTWSQANLHWNEIADQNMLTQALGTGGRPTQKEYLGCLIGDVKADTFHVIGLVPAHDMKRFQFAVTGSCDSVVGVIGTFHTHPYRAAPTGEALKEPGLSRQDLMTFMSDTDRALIVVWDVDSLDVALRSGDGRVVHPALLVPR